MKEKEQSVWRRKINFGVPGIIAALIYYFSRYIAVDFCGELVSLVIAIVFGILYIPLKKKIHFIKNTIISNFITAVLLIILAAFLIGFLTAFCRLWIK